MKYLFTSLLAVAFGSALHAGDWPQFRGPNSSGIADQTNVPVKWSKKENLRYKVKLPGRGLSNPVIAEGRIYVTCSSGWQQNRLHVLCLDEKTGEKLWERQFWGIGGTQAHPKTCMAAPTPVTDGKFVYALFATHDLVALDKDGNLQWFRSLTSDYPTVGNNVGMASSPVLAGDTLVLAVENVGESFAVGIDTKTGQNRWKEKRERGINWVTPLVIERNDRPEVLVQSPKKLTSYDVKTGKKRWEFTQGKLSTIPSPVFGNGLVLAPGGTYLYALRPSGENAEPEVVWKSRKLSSGYASPLYYQDHVYTLTTQGVFRCADANTGEEIWDIRFQGPFAASHVAADGKIFLTNEEGKTIVLKAGGKKAEVLAVNEIGDTILASPVIANGAVYLRSDDFLYCFGPKQ